MSDRFFLDTNVFAYSFYDSLILAAAFEGKAQVLYTEDLQDGHEIEDLRIVDPFR